MLGIVMLSTMVLLYRVSQLPPRSLARKAGSLSTASRERAIRAYYSARQPDWRNRPPLLVQKTHRHSHSRKVAIVPEKWYGSSRQVGPSPYDYTPRALQQDERKTRLLFLVEFRDYLERMNSHTYELQVRRLSSHLRLLMRSSQNRRSISAPASRSRRMGSWMGWMGFQTEAVGESGATRAAWHPQSGGLWLLVRVGQEQYTWAHAAADRSHAFQRRVLDHLGLAEPQTRMG